MANLYTMKNNQSPELFCNTFKVSIFMLNVGVECGLYPNWAADFALNGLLRCSFKLHFSDFVQFAEPVAPSRRKYHEGCASIDQGIASDFRVRIRRVCDPYGCYDSPHLQFSLLHVQAPFVLCSIGRTTKLSRAAMGLNVSQGRSRRRLECLVGNPIMNTFLFSIPFVGQWRNRREKAWQTLAMPFLW
ncbi:MAG: hypothetical protein Q8O31_03640 [Rhodocyclaceae bacterium]|nr:hypothetical protein [Rhodocyclaceae bacterium]